MNKRIAIIFTVTAVVGAIFWFNAMFSDWLGPKKIQIMYRIVPAKNVPGAKGPLVSFYLPRGNAVTSIKVYSETEAKTNKFPHASWHLTAAGEPPKVESFVYGMAVTGMKPEVANTAADVLSPGDEYRLVVEAKNKTKGEITFHLPPN